MSNEKKTKAAERSLMITLAAVMVVVIAVAIIGFTCINRPAEIVEGQVEGVTVRVSGKMPGRVTAFFVQEGDTVQQGDTLVHVHSSIVDAKLIQAQAMEQAAKAMDRKADAGVRAQVIASAADLVAQAEAAVTITRKTCERLENLYAEGVVTEQKRDEARAALAAAEAQLSVARNQYSLALDGAQKEDREAAAAMAAVASGGVDEVNALLEDSYLTAPCSGTVDVIYPEPGELVATGTPLLTLLKDERYVTFNVREELLSDLPMGAEITLMIPALGRKEIKARVYYIRDMGSYATWQSTKSTGQWNSRTFQIKARPVDQVENLRPGMSAIYLK